MSKKTSDNDLRKNNPHTQHRTRLRKRFQNEGLDTFEPHEQLELLLQYPIKQIDTNGLAHSLLDRFGSISGVIDAPVSELETVENIGRTSSTFLKLILELGKRYSTDRSNEDRYTSVINTIGERYVEEFDAANGEYYSAVMLDDNYNIVGSEVFQECSHENEPFDTDKLAKLLFRYKCTSFIVLHNKLGDITKPTNDDLLIAAELPAVFEPINRWFVEYLIISYDRFIPVKHYLDSRSNSHC